MIGKIGLLLCVFGLLTQTVMAQALLNGSRLAGNASTSARFTLGLSKDNGSSYVTSATTADSIRIIGTIQPEPAQLGQPADIYIVARIGTQYFMRNAAGNFVPWSFAIPELVPFRTQQTLTSNFPVDFITAKIPVTGTMLLFLGYKAADGVLTYTPAPHQITINTPPAPVNTTLEQATSMFNTSIAPIVEGICIACHIQGGQASGTGLIYVTSNTANHLTTNFNTLKNFAVSNGRQYILFKASNQISHDGGALLPQGTSSYNAMNSFLQLVEKL